MRFSLQKLKNRILHSESRTNNHTEGANMRLNIEMGVGSLTIWTFINCLGRVQTDHDVFMAQLTTGRSPLKKFKNIIYLPKSSII